MELQKSSSQIRQERVEGVISVMRTYQLSVLLTLVREKRHLNYMEPGMGKSITTLTAIMQAEAFPCIIVCTKSATYVWEEELRKWYGEPCTIYSGKPKQREAQLKDFIAKGHKFIITNYALSEELGQKCGLVPINNYKVADSRGTIKPKGTPPPGTPRAFGGLIADEIHGSGLFNHKSTTYGVFKKLTKSIPYVYLLTGTPYRKGVIDFFGPLSIVRPDLFDSYWKYVTKFCSSINTGFGKSIERNPKDIEAFRIMIRLHAIIMKSADYLDELPGKIRQSIPIVMNVEQERMYNELQADLMAITDNGKLVMSPSALALTVRQRQLLACPQELGLKDRGTAIDTMLEMVEDHVEEAKPFVIFTPFKRAVYWISKALKDTYPGITTFEITGGLTPEEFRDAWQGFQNANSKKATALICVIRSGASFHSTVASDSYFIGYEWDFNQNLQAEDRLNRIGQTRLCINNYFKYKNTIDGEVLQKNNDKKFSSDLILSEQEAYEVMRDKMRGEPSRPIVSHLTMTENGMHRRIISGAED